MQYKLRIKNRRRAERFLNQCFLVKELYKAVKITKQTITELHAALAEEKRIAALTPTLPPSLPHQQRMSHLKGSIKEMVTLIGNLKPLIKQAQRGVQYLMVEVAEADKKPYIMEGPVKYNHRAFFQKKGAFDFLTGGKPPKKRINHS